MQFQLPSNLQTELLAYDPKLKALACDKEPKKASKKSKYPLGNIPHIVPADVLRPADQQGAIDIINAAPAPQRIHSFTRPVDVATPQARTATHALIYHYEQCWYACWLPPKGQEDKYVYGHAYCFKDTAAAARTVPKSIWNSREDCTQTQVGRNVFYHRVRLVTKEDIANGYNGHHWRPQNYCSYADKVRQYISPCINNFEKELKESIPVWVDEQNFFARMKCTSVARALDINTELLPMNFSPKKWVPNYETVLELATKSNSTGSFIGAKSSYGFMQVKEILSTPFFRKWINSKCEDIIKTYNDPGNEYRRNITKHWKEIFRLADAIMLINNIWPDCPVDYYQNNIDVLLSVEYSYRHGELSCQPVNKWLNENMPVASFFKILNKYYQESRASAPGRDSYYFHEWSDTFSMLVSLLITGENELAPPRRWRLNEFHDYVQAETWKIRNPNEKLPQDLFPKPIKVELDFADGFQNTWTFFQPHDTHQLAMWGRAVRNCVGSASHYAADVRKRKHFIVLAMIENKPMFPIQLKVDMGVMSVCQIAGIGNERLDETERELYTEAFQLALHERETQLKS